MRDYKCFLYIQQANLLMCVNFKKFWFLTDNQTYTAWSLSQPFWRKVPIIYYVFGCFKKKCVCCLIYLCVDQIDPFYTILEQEGWFRPTARLLFLILRVFVQSYDKNIKWQRDSWFAVTFSPPIWLSSHQSSISVGIFECLTLNDKYVHPNWDSVPIMHRQRCHRGCNI